MSNPPSLKPDLSRLAIDKSALGGKPSRSQVPAVVVGCVALALLVIFLFSRRSVEPEPGVVTEVSALVAAAPAALAGALNASGYVVAQRKAAVASKATGRLKELRVVEGDVVKEGEVIAILENEDLQALVSERKANVRALEARVEYSKTELEDSKRDRERAQQLSASQVLSRAELDEAVARHKKAVSEVRSVEANLVLAQAQLEKANVDLSYTQILAPFDGTVLTKNADVGEIVAPFGSSPTARAAVVTIADMNSLEVEADVSEANITRVFVGQETEITLDSFPSKKYRGVVNKIVPTVDRAKATVLTKIKFTDRDERVLPEMSAKVLFLPQKESKPA